MAERYGVVRIPRLVLESGRELRDAPVAWSMQGEIGGGRPLVLVCHALTGSHHLAGPDVPGLPGAWWDPLVGPGKAVDTNRFTVVAFNNLGSPYGSASPLTADEEGRPWAMRFPVVSPRDIARSQHEALRLLGAERVDAVLGGSLGGMIALERIATFPDETGACVSIACPTRLYPQAIAYNEVQRQAILSDPDWKNGDYAPGPGPTRGLATARMLAMITYRSEQVFTNRWMRDLASGEPHEWGGRFQVESYLHHHGEELVRRFDANCYLYLTRAMDLHDLGRGRGGVEAALRGFAGKPLLSVGISSDLLFPNWQAEEVARTARSAGIRADYDEIESEDGHDAFLLAFDQVDDLLRGFFARAGLLPNLDDSGC
jgi:homoserine O-acetyltransferase